MCLFAFIIPLIDVVYRPELFVSICSKQSGRDGHHGRVLTGGNILTEVMGAVEIGDKLDLILMRVSYMLSRSGLAMYYSRIQDRIGFRLNMAGMPTICVNFRLLLSTEEAKGGRSTRQISDPRLDEVEGDDCGLEKEDDGQSGSEEVLQESHYATCGR